MLKADNERRLSDKAHIPRLELVLSKVNVKYWMDLGRVIRFIAQHFKELDVRVEVIARRGNMRKEEFEEKVREPLINMGVTLEREVIK